MDNRIREIDLCIEECCELIQALCKVKRCLIGDPTVRKNLEACKMDLIEEIADVSLTIDNIVNVFNISPEMVAELIELKRERTRNLLEE